MIKSPRISIIMPVFNAGEFLLEAIESVLSQTYHDFELIIINDGSTDNSSSIIRTIQDYRVRRVECPQNRGIIEVLNIGIDLCTGEFIARMDADDICEPERLYSQIEFMDSHPSVGVCGTLAVLMNGELMNRYKGIEELKASLLLDNVFVHSSVMFRKKLVDEYGLRYSVLAKHVEDYQMWTEFAKVSDLALVPVVGIRYRISPGQISSMHKDVQLYNADVIRRRLFTDLLGHKASDAQESWFTLGNEKKQLEFCSLRRLYCEVFQFNVAYQPPAIDLVFKKLFARNFRAVKFSFLGFCCFLDLPFLTVKEKLSVIKSFIKTGLQKGLA